MRLGLLLALALLGRTAAAASPAEIERDVARAAGERDTRRAERQQVQAQAAAAAERVAALKRPGGGTDRAGSVLARELREFDRLAARLDALERELATFEQRLARLRTAFEAAADDEEGRLEERARREGAAAVAPQIEALRAARQRIAGQAEAPGFRPPLDIGLSALDGVAELEAKLALIDGERARITQRLVEARREETLLATRMEAKREWARQLAAARRDAAGSVDLLDRGYEEAQSALRGLAARIEALARERSTLEEAEQRLRARRTEAEGRLAELRKGR